MKLANARRVLVVAMAAEVAVAVAVAAVADTVAVADMVAAAAAVVDMAAVVAVTVIVTVVTVVRGATKTARFLPTTSCHRGVNSSILRKRREQTAPGPSRVAMKISTPGLSLVPAAGWESAMAEPAADC